MSSGYAASGELTPRMREVLTAAAAGKRAAETALELGISERTVRAILAASCARLHARTITAAAVRADRRGELL